MAFFGDGATNIGAFHEALNLAAVWRLPVLFVCENNLYMEHTLIAVGDRLCGEPGGRPGAGLRPARRGPSTATTSLVIWLSTGVTTHDVIGSPSLSVPTSTASSLLTRLSPFGPVLHAFHSNHDVLVRRPA